ncbi:MAG: bifunctional [glutamate--ammonia ligase]-adenylyl-L-tyrosine phosphorylase/[glutamate--ammonia-ligase] adenylyltransferase [Nitrospirae bacterium]|nr:MAG: bifunctional [glutamate--ammonia ligase]-adenylyl-L-tyrosine phosphorylase/[glutamate--ammonia-ligase] adenylyltransferase [Nitrospirota bacterium]
MRQIPDVPDQDRAKNNIEAFLSAYPGHSDIVDEHIEKIALLFSNSQFLANHSLIYPEDLIDALGSFKYPTAVQTLRGDLKDSFLNCSSVKEGMKVVRRFRKKHMLSLTLKDLLRTCDMQEVMLEMSLLADVVIEGSLNFIEPFIAERYGAPANASFVALALGKLGAEELNYSSDVDLIFAYAEDCETTGISTVQGVTINRITASEYYAKLIEELSRFLSLNTEDGFAYRVDLRLRPQGQKGNLAMALSGYEEYYESWGQLWERAMLLRARPVAGDMELGERFCDVISPFVYRKYLDLDTIEEIRKMKAQVEHIKSGTLSRDIKRGYGGIREIEFFIQIFQLIYGGKEPHIREKSTIKGLHKLLQKRFIGYEDFKRLSDNYIFFRTLEHRLQQMNDLQTHSLPSGEHELQVLALKLGYKDKESFAGSLASRRSKVREIYDSLLEKKGEDGEKQASILSRVFWDIESPVENLLADELRKSRVSEVHRAMHCLMRIRNNISSFQTIKGRRLLESLVPQFVDDAIERENADAVLSQLVDFSLVLATKESYLEALARRPGIVSTLNFVFAHSGYISRIIMQSPEYLESLVGHEVKLKLFGELKSELAALIEKQGMTNAIRFLRKTEEVRLGILYLNNSIGVNELVSSLSRTAEAIFSELAAVLSPDVAVIAFGKFGGRELAFNSDLDIVFASDSDPSLERIKSAERLLKVFTSYTKDGVAYQVDTRLRPEGSKGPLVVSIEGLRKYYFNNAHAWEVQALLKARPVAGNKGQSATGRLFSGLRRDVLVRRGNEIKIEELRRMRERIEKELADSSKGFDLKLGQGGLEELEFGIQYLQLRHCDKHPELLVQGTVNALRRLEKFNVLGSADAKALCDIYLFYRTVQSLMRLQEESVLSPGSASFNGIAGFLGTDGDGFGREIEKNRLKVSDFWNSLS